MPVLTEDHIEQILIQEFIDLEYQYLNGLDISPEGSAPERAYHEVVLRARLQSAIARLNPTVPAEAQDEALRKVLRSDSPTCTRTTTSFTSTSPKAWTLNTARVIESWAIKFGSWITKIPSKMNFWSSISLRLSKATSTSAPK